MKHSYFSDKTVPIRPSLVALVALIVVGAADSLFATQAAAGAPIQIAGNPVELRLGFTNDGVVRLQLLPIDAQGNVIESPDEPLLTPQTWKGEPLRSRELPTQAVSRTLGECKFTFDPTNWTIRLEAPLPGPPREGEGAKPLFVQVKIDPATGRVSFPLDGPVFGLGEGGKQFDRRGEVNLQEVGGWNNADHPLNDWGEHLGIPWIVSPRGWGIYIHRPDVTFDLTGDQANTSVRAQRGRGGRRGRGDAGQAEPTTPPPQPIDIFIAVAREPAGLMKAWAQISGYPSLVPIWSLGYIQSHRELKSAEQILTVAKTFREKKLPCDMLIYLGSGFVPIGWNTGHGQFTFKPDAFPNPDEQLRQFKDLHFHVALHVTPQGANPLRRLAGQVTDEVPAGATDPNSVAYYWSLHAPLMKQGVDAWWPDEGEGLPAASRLARIQMYFEGPQQVHPDQRPYALHRTGAVGMQRYGGWLWSGDIKSNWAVLARHVPLGLNTSVSATPYWGTDTGGFYPAPPDRELTGELFARWFQYSAFCPLFRSHGQQWQFRHLPWGFGDIQGPSRDDRVEEICRTYLDLRYQVMPYTYSAMYEGHEDGMPIMRPLWLHYPQDAAAVARGDEYLWGRDMLVAPVVEKGQTERKVYLPAGNWFDYWTGEKQAGGREITRTVDLATMPLYVRAGAILPFGPKENYTEEKPNDPLTIRIYPGADGQFTMIEDDGVTFSSVPMRLRFTWNDAARTLRVALEEGSQLRVPTPRHLTVQVVGTDATKSAEFRGQALELRF